MSLVRPLLISLALAAASLTTSAFAGLPEDIQRRIEDEATSLKIGDRTIDLAPLKDAYRAKSYHSLWAGASLQDGQLAKDVQSLAASEGLPPEAYALPTADLPAADRELLLSDAIVRLGHDLASGRVSPTRALGGMGPETRPAFDPAQFLKDVSAAQDPMARIRAAHPPYAGYALLKNAMVRYQALVNAGGWPTTPDGPSIKPGQEDPRIPTIRKRLMITGDLDAKYEKGKVLDQPLAAALRRFQVRHGIENDGAVGKQTLAALNVSAEDRLRQIQVNLERWRWMPRALDPNHVAVNLPAAHLDLVRDGQIELSMRVVVGDVEHQTPGMQTSMGAVVMNPTWTVPPSIATREILPKLRKDPRYLANNNMRILDAFPEGSAKSVGSGIDWASMSKFPWRLRQAPGADNALGQLKFVLSNSDDIYLHDTPRRQYFDRIFRALSHGCVRLEDPVALARAVLPTEWGPKIPEIITGDDTKTVRLEKPLTVYLYYMTAWTEEDGQVQFRDDLYGHDGRLKAVLKRRTPAAQMAQDHPQGTL